MIPGRPGISNYHGSDPQSSDFFPEARPPLTPYVLTMRSPGNQIRILSCSAASWIPGSAFNMRVRILTTDPLSSIAATVPSRTPSKPWNMIGEDMAANDTISNVLGISLDLSILL